jgi:uncharacterized membrane protein YuzA (DUF378 family)
MHKSILYWVAFVLLVVGGLNWGLVGLFNFDIVATLFGSIPIVAQIVYVLVGLGAVWMLVYKLTKKKRK